MKLTKKLISLILIVVMAFSSLSVAVSAEPWANHNVQVYIEGFESKWVYHPDDPDTSLLFPIDMGRVGAEIGRLGENLKGDIKSLSPDTVYNIWYRTIYNLFGETRLEPDGVTMQSTVTVPETTINKKSDGRFVFKYDTRLDPVDVCKDLYEYLGWVYDDEDAATMRDDDGYLNIEFLGSSYGAAVLLAFLNEHGYSIDNDDMKIKYDSVMFCVPTINGVDFVSEIFTGNFNIDPDALDAFLDSMNLGEDIDLVIDTLDKTGVLDALLALVAEPAMKLVLRRSLHDSIVDIFGTFPSFWSFVSAESFEKALDYVYNTDELRVKYAAIIDKVTYYNNEIKVKADDIILGAVAEGIKVNIVCKYGKPYFPLVKEGNVMGDGFVTLASASFGATSSMNEETLPKRYVQKNFADKNYMSIDRCVDASTCLLPENTWFIKNLGHGIKPDAYFDVVNNILYNNLNVFSNADCPQFLYCGDDGETISSLESVYTEPEKEPNVFEVLIMFFKMIFSKIAALINK